MKGLDNVSLNLLQSYTENEFKGNAIKCHLLINSGENVDEDIGTSQIKNRVVLGIDIDCKLSLENHIKKIGSKARTNIKALAKIAPFVNKGKRNLLINAFFKSQFCYCPWSWMFQSRKLNNINILHETLAYNIQQR